MCSNGHDINNDKNYINLDLHTRILLLCNIDAYVHKEYVTYNNIVLVTMCTKQPYMVDVCLNIKNINEQNEERRVIDSVGLC